MTPEQKTDYLNLRTVPERAPFLLNIGVSSRINMKGLDLVSQATVGDVLLPVTADSDEEAVTAGIAWLKEKADSSEGAASVALQDGSRIDSVKKGFAACVADAELNDVHPHDLRRTFGSWLVQAGVGIERVSGLLRHGDVAITARVYAHLRPSDLAATVAILDRPEQDQPVTYLHTGNGKTEEARKSRS